MTRRARVSLITAASVPVVLYLGMIGCFMRAEPSLVYRPSREIRLFDPAFRNDVRAVTLASEDGTRLSARILRSGSGSSRWIFLLPANAGNTSTHQHWWRAVHSAGANLFTLDYRGFGDSDGTPSERGLYSDATAGYRYLVEREHVAPADIILYGHSLGSAVAIDLAARLPVAGLIVEGAMTSIPAVGQEKYPFLPVSLIATNRFDSMAKIAAVGCPKLFFHAREDRRVPFRQAEQLYELATEPKELVPLNGDHTSAITLDGALIVERIRVFLQTSLHHDRRSAW